MTHIPRFHLHLWEGAAMVNFQQLTEYEWVQKRKQLEQWQVFEFKGSSCYVYCLVDGYNIDRQKALKTASAFVNGLYVSLEVDLWKLEVSEVNGKPFSTPVN